MKKFLTVLLVIAVMFTFSFGSAFAAAPTADQKANLLAAESYALGIAERNFATALDNIGDETISGYVIKEAAWEALEAEMLPALKKTVTDTTDSLIANYTYSGSATTTSALAEDIYGLATYYSVDVIKSWIISNYQVKAAAKQFAADQADLVDKVDHVDLSLYSTTTPTTGDTYYEMAVAGIASLKEGIYDPAVDVTAYTTVGEYKSRITTVTSWINSQLEATYVGNTSILSGLYKLTGAVATGIKTIADESATEISNAAIAAQVKANAQKEYAAYVVKSGANKDFATAYVEVVSFLADQGEVNATNVNGTLDLDTVDTASIVARYEAALNNVAEVTAYATKMKAEKNAAGELVRDAATVDKLVKTYKTEEFKYAYFALSQPSKVGVKEAIEGAVKENIDAELAFEIEAAKYAMNDARDTALYSYYPLEQEKVNAEFDKKIAAIEKAKTVADAWAVTAPTLTGIKTKSNVRAAVQATTEYTNQLAVLNKYVDYKNAGLTSRDAAYVVNTTLGYSLADFYGKNGARTAAEIKALAADTTALVDALPTVGGIAAAKAEAEAAIKAIPATVTVEDQATVQAAWDAAVAYVDMTDTAGADYTAAIANTDISNKATLASKIDKLHSAMALDLAKKSAAVSKTDKAALKAIAEEIEAFDDLHYGDEMFENDARYADTTVADALATIRTNERDAVIAAINALPVNVTEADKAQVEAARKLYDAYVDEYKDIETDDYAPRNITNFRELALAEAALGLNYDAEENAKAYVQDLSIKARSVKTSKGVKITIKADVQQLLDDGFTVEYRFYRSTKSNKNFGKPMIVKSTNTYTNTKGVKGTRYYYKAKIVVKNAAGEVIATTPLTQCLYATRVF